MRLMLNVSKFFCTVFGVGQWFFVRQGVTNMMLFVYLFVWCARGCQGFRHGEDPSEFLVHGF